MTRSPDGWRRRRTELGAAGLIMTLFIAILMIPLAAISVDTARLYVEVERVQAAADAAATAGVTYMPDDFANAQAKAVEVAGRNGYPNSGTSSVTVAPGEKPTQLKVTVSSTIPNAFGRFIGVNTGTTTRSAVADFNGPAPMGSPCNTFGNEPAGSAALGPTGSQLQVPPYATCPQKPEFWGSIAGPDVDKNQGSQFETRYCGGGEDGCSGSTNSEFDPRGFVYLVRVNAAGVGRPVTLQIYDPAYVSTGSRCTNEPYDKPGDTTSPPAVWGNSWNLYAVNESRQRYWRTGTSWGGYADPSRPNEFCTGDDPNTSLYSGSAAETVTSFGLRQPVDTLVPFNAPPVAGCARQYEGYRADDVSLQALNLLDSRYDSNLAKVFHQWVTLCTFVPTQAGDYYLQVRNNVALGGTDDGQGGRTGNTTMFTQAGDDTSVRGTGTNQFGLRAITSAPAGSVSIAAWEKMRIFANSNSATTTFNLVRVVPAAANKTLVLSFFDVGEGASSGSVRVLPPADSNLPSTVTGCIGAGVRNGALSGCEITGITPSGYNGKYQEIRVPIPNTYTCQISSQGGCWFRIQVSFGSGQVTDATTWTARIVGEPVRLIE